MKPLILGLVFLITLAACAADGSPAAEPELPAEAGAPASAGALSPVTAVPTPAVPPAPAAGASESAETASPAGAPAQEGSIGVSEPVSPVVVDLSQITPLPPASSEPVEMPRPGSPTGGVGGVMRLVTADLARRQTVEMEQIALVDYEEVTWPNAGLGCPEADMMYLSVLTPGYKITLSLNGVDYTYHTNQRDHFVLCANGKPVLE